MKKFNTLLNEYQACQHSILWAQEMSIEEIVKKCYRGDWLLWLGKKIDLPIKDLTLAKGKCAETVIHIMKDERSKKAVKNSIKFGKGKLTIIELEKSFSAAARFPATE